MRPVTFTLIPIRNTQIMITDFELHAFVDDQLSSRERRYVLEQIATSPALAGRLAELQRLKQLVRAAYQGNTKRSTPDAERHALPN